MRKSMAVCAMAAVLTLAVAAVPSIGGIQYDEKMASIWVTDFPSSFPCTMKRVKAVNDTQGWGKVDYDAASATYTVKCSLIIGSNDGTETYFQIGTSDNPKETVVLQGNMFVFPFFIAGENEGVYWRVPVLANRLTLGSPDDSSIRAALKFDNRKRGEFGLTVGRVPAASGKTGAPFGGQLHVYNSVITALKQDADHTCAGFVLDAQETVLANAELSWSAGFLGYGISEGVKRVVRVSNTLFDHGQAGVLNGRVLVKDSKFSNLEWAVNDYGGIDATFENCVFENNNCNWYLRFTPRGVTCIDCVIGPPLKKDIFVAETTVSVKEKKYGSLVSRRHIIVEVVDQQGKPVKGAQVTVRCEQDVPEAVDNRQQVTNDAGRTAGRADKAPVLLTEFVRKVTDSADVVDLKEYTYAVRAEAPGYSASEIFGFKPAESWKVIRLTLKK